MVRYIALGKMRQIRSFMAGCLICSCAATIGHHFYYFEDSESDKQIEIYNGKNQFSLIDVLIYVMYFLGACIGGIICGVYQYIWPVRMTNYVMGGLLIVACGFLFWLNTAAWCIARFLAGVSFGFTYISLVAQIADLTWFKDRGSMAISFLSISKVYGLLMGTITILFFKSSHNRENTAIYYLLILFPVLSLIINRFSVYESITRLLKMGLEAEAKNTLIDLRIVMIHTSVIHEVIKFEIVEKKLMLLEDYVSSKRKFCNFFKLFQNGNAIPIILLVGLRFLYVLTTNMFLFMLSANSVGDEPFLKMMLLSITRFMIVSISQSFIDSVGRRKLLLVSGIGSGILLFPFVAHNMGYIAIDGFPIVIITYAIHAFTAIGIDPVQAAYETEAFPLNFRNSSLAVVSCFEYILQGMIVTWVLLGEEILLKSLLVATPSLVTLFTIILFVRLPETKLEPIYRCRQAFNKNILETFLQNQARRQESSIDTSIGVIFIDFEIARDGSDSDDDNNSESSENTNIEQ